MGKSVADILQNSKRSAKSGKPRRRRRKLNARLKKRDSGKLKVELPSNMIRTRHTVRCEHR
jgi:hypothetical protein